jgi:hypothetical protein
LNIYILYRCVQKLSKTWPWENSSKKKIIPKIVRDINDNLRTIFFYIAQKFYASNLNCANGQKRINYFYVIHSVNNVIDLLFHQKWGSALTFFKPLIKDLLLKSIKYKYIIYSILVLWQLFPKKLSSNQIWSKNNSYFILCKIWPYRDPKWMPVLPSVSVFSFFHNSRPLK